ncbi:Anthranilate 3-monooxygenase oxygenase component [Pigmentiphaga humi]|uniref:Anthranilate 3-monooxygenase oxygenase component n=1 Tax=Pigmentiphaga humi TaxID=2478468 RepID=A0A3P4AZ83_9BURK|nr:4-hydroxyphenylacetate 3-hydroxylase N-terminal domain-containing protein [Pigmentiphaga humi]VCU69347.1 Anthranilate 3-monooxygenase oxygenase component [Pigmentiphaga humi]
MNAQSKREMTNLEPRPSSSQAGGLRPGDEYLRSLNDGRAVYMDGQLVKDVTRHPAFAASARSAARLFDTAADPSLRERMTFVSPSSGNPVLRAYQIPRTHADLKAKRLASETWSEGSFGMIGRTPDHVAGFFTGYAAVPEVFAAGGQQFADNVVGFYEHLRENHLWATYAIVPPQIDRSKPAHKQTDPTLYAGVVKERDDGIVISGAQQLATAGVLSDYLYLSCIHPLQPGDENYAIGVALPMNAPGMKLYPRRSFALQAANSFDYPLSSRFDETDCFVVFKDVFVPWEHVFIYRNTQVCRDQWWRTPSHAYGNLQAQARYATKLRFMMGLAKRMNEMTGNDAHPQVQVQMGEMAAQVQLVESMLEAQETRATIDAKGVVWPCAKSLYAIMALQSEMNPRMIDMIRELTGAAMISLPSSLQDLESPETAGDIERYMRSANSDARSRIALMRMAWDFIGTEFGNRSQQYEKFYGGASFLVKQNMYRSYDFARGTAMVDAALNLPPEL